MKSESNYRIFEEIYNVGDYEVYSPNGWVTINKIMKTIPYKGMKLECEDGLFITAVEDHILITSENEEIFVKDCFPGLLLKSKNGVSKVSKVYSLDRTEECFDLEIDDQDHIFYVNGLASHNCVTGKTLLRVRENDKNLDVAKKEVTGNFDMTIEDLYNCYLTGEYNA